MTIDYDKLKDLEQDITEIEKKLKITYKKRSIENKYIRDSKSRISGNTSSKKLKAADDESQISFKI